MPPDLMLQQCCRTQGIALGRGQGERGSLGACMERNGAPEHFTRPSDFFGNNQILPEAL
jgi:hypothetical protein